VIFVTDKPTDWRALCAELVDGWVEGCDIAGPIARARTALAQPEPEGPTDEELYQFWESHPELGLTCDEPVKLLRAGLTRFARPTTNPVPVAERPWEREGWCDAEGMCWRFDPCDRGWWSYGPILPSDGDPAPFTYLLPHHALPIPNTH